MLDAELHTSTEDAPTMALPTLKAAGLVWGLANVASSGPSFWTIVGPALIGVATLWNTYINHQRFRLDRDQARKRSHHA